MTNNKDAHQIREEMDRDELILRNMLAIESSGFVALYLDDGELQDGSKHPVIDYLRDDPALIRDKLNARRVAKLHEQSKSIEELNARPAVVPGSQWRHKNGNVYQVLTLVNESSDRPEYPVGVVYYGLGNSKVWHRLLSDWHRSMTLITNEPIGER